MIHPSLPVSTTGALQTLNAGSIIPWWNIDPTLALQCLNRSVVGDKPAVECKSPEPRAKNTIVNVPVHCHSPYTSCSAVFETDPSAISGFYPDINVEGVVTVVYCIKP